MRCLNPITQLTKYPVLNTFEQRTQVPKSYAVLGGVLLLTLFHFVNSLAGPVSTLIGWAVPAFLSFKALESPGHQDDIQWLTYWVVFGFFNFTESFALRLVLYYFPWYFAFKTIFIIWLQLPTFRVSPTVLLAMWPANMCYLLLQGAQVVYLSVLKPILANVNKNANAMAPTSSTADSLRERVGAASE
jgi:receptor expression-enhancing protein 5/6